MRMQVLFYLMRLDLRLFFRARLAMFWTFAFPVLLLVVQMGLFGHAAALRPVSLCIVDLDGSAESAAFVFYMKRELALQKVVRFDIFSGSNMANSRSPEEQDVLLTIPHGFEDHVLHQKETVIPLSTKLKQGPLYDASFGLLRALSTTYNLHVIAAPQRVLLQTPVSPASQLDYGLYLVTGLSGMIILSSSLMGFAGPLVAAREGGMFKLYQLFPMKTELVVIAWWLSRLCVTLLASIFMLVIARLLYDVRIDTTSVGLCLALCVMVLGTGASLALGMLIAALCPTVISVAMVSNILYFPLMLASDLVIPLDSLPRRMQELLSWMPLHAMVDAIRGCMMNQSDWHLVGYSVIASLLTLSVALFFSAKHFTWAPRG